MRLAPSSRRCVIVLINATSLFLVCVDHITHQVKQCYKDIVVLFVNSKSKIHFKHFRSPMVTGTSVVGVTFDKGVMLAADTLGSYGSLARFRSISRMRKVTDSCAVAASGDYADFQYMDRLFENLT